MKYSTIFILILVLSIFLPACFPVRGDFCFTGAFMADEPRDSDIDNFEMDYGKKPYFVMVFVDWGSYLNENVTRDIYGKKSVLFVTWEPWYARVREPIDYQGLLAGKYDEYVVSFAEKIKAIDNEVFLRFAHEVNGNWYPWSGHKLGKDRYIALVRYVRSIFNRMGVNNVKWVFSINSEDVPIDNHYWHYYPGDEFVDYVGIDGYNWGDTQSWSRWLSFKDIFFKMYNDVVSRYNKLVVISEFGSTSHGGNKKMWINNAMAEIKKMKKVRGFVIFNLDKETDWSLSPTSDPGREFKKQLSDPYFRNK